MLLERTELTQDRKSLEAMHCLCAACLGAHSFLISSTDTKWRRPRAFKGRASDTTALFWVLTTGCGLDSHLKAPGNQLSMKALTHPGGELRTGSPEEEARAKERYGPESRNDLYVC